ncbi:hypothetical protein EGH24_13770 [Halonotius terrestris]|uniref:Uncharacterized protein n=1 Tax=Halonotius terrestris TaxID=2487750 RepID=A0A8J8PAM0_9EURY|nr:hypothetical protein [Halonotius terrestris]TQQ78585.1 hypothetical protein EGH24_13770 [Halonotius terrestris]
MTEHMITVEKTVEEDEQVFTCDYCGLGDDAGEVIEYAPDAGDTLRFALGEEADDSMDELPALHYHVSCLSDVIASELQAEQLTLTSQYKRRTGNGILLAFPAASVPFLAGSAALLWVGYPPTEPLSAVAMGIGGAFGLFTLWGARQTATASLEEFTA